MGEISDNLKTLANKVGKKNETFALKFPFIKKKIDDIIFIFELYHDTIEELENKIDSLEERIRDLEDGKTKES